MTTKDAEARSTQARARAESSFRKEERAKEGAKAMMEYQADGRAVREQMARLRALRLAKEAADAAAPAPPAPAKKAPRTKR